MITAGILKDREMLKLADVIEATALDRYMTTRKLETLWGREWGEIEALGRLRASLRALGGDL